MIKDFPEQYFVGGGEESFGFMVGDFVRDKDAVTATLLACEIAAQAKDKGSTMFKELLQLYIDYGFYKEHLISITKKGIEGAEEIKQMMVDARENPLQQVNGNKVVRIDDYQLSVSKDIITGKESNINIPKSNVLIYHTEDGSKIALRPSGTEPKIKFYCSVNDTIATSDEYDFVANKLNEKIDQIMQELTN